jgi:hypothetical protein
MNPRETEVAMITTKRILMSEAGEIECEEHTPFRGSDTWIYGRWRPMTLTERMDFEAELGRAPECETCAAIARNAGKNGERP